MVHGAWCMVHGAWCMVHGAWCMVHGAWCMVHGAKKEKKLHNFIFYYKKHYKLSGRNYKKCKG
jgi:hypothetical protein